MALLRTRTVGALALAFAVAGAVWFFATTKDATQELAPQRAESVSADAVPPALEPRADKRESQEPDDAIPIRQRSPEEHAAAVKHALASAMSPDGDRVVERLVAEGLSQADAERVTQHAMEGYADCIYEAAHAQYEAQGDLSEFLDHTELEWTLAATNLQRVRAAMAPCLTNIDQQIGLANTGRLVPVPRPANFASGGSLEERIVPPPPLSPWAAEMDRRIHDHVALHPGLGVTDVFVQCREEGCSAMLVGRDIRIFDFDFDVFAEQNGFQKAVVGGDSRRRSVWLER